MAGLASRLGVAPAAIGSLAVLDWAAASLVLRADQTRVYLLNRPIDLVCGFRARFGLPCPACGMTRSLVLSLHGHWMAGWRLSPAGPAIVLGLVLFAAAMLALAWIELAGFSGLEIRIKRWVRRSALIYGGATACVWTGGWASSFMAAFDGR